MNFGLPTLRGKWWTILKTSHWFDVECPWPLRFIFRHSLANLQGEHSSDKNHLAPYGIKSSSKNLFCSISFFVVRFLGANRRKSSHQADLLATLTSSKCSPHIQRTPQILNVALTVIRRPSPPPIWLNEVLTTNDHIYNQASNSSSQNSPNALDSEFYLEFIADCICSDCSLDNVFLHSRKTIFQYQWEMF